MKAKINEKIKLLRQNNGLTQAQMAERLDMSVNAYGAIERGETKIISENLDLILSEFKMELLDFLSIGEDGVICIISKNKHNIGIKDIKNNGHIVINNKDENAVVYTNDSGELTNQVEELQGKIIAHENIMEELKKKLIDLTELISLLKN